MVVSRRMSSISSIVVSSFLIIFLGFIMGTANCNRNVLSVQWGKSFCLRNSCIANIPNYLTVHGLWPDVYGPSPKTQPFDFVQLQQVGGLVKRLNFWWPNLRYGPGRSNKRFWKHEWETHGACAIPTMQLTEYISKTVTLIRNHDFMAMLKSEGIEPGMNYSFIDLQGRAASFWENPEIKCIRIARSPLKFAVSEFRFCVNDDGTSLIQCQLGGLRLPLATGSTWGSAGSKNAV